MDRAKNFVLMVSIVILIPFPSVADLCDSATEVNNPQRSTSFIVDPTSDPVRCDIPWRAGWYKFNSKAGQEIPITCPPLNSCVRSWSTYPSNSTISPYKESNHYFAGIIVEPRQLQFQIFEGGDPLTLTLKATVPIACQGKKNCKVMVDLGQENEETFLGVCTVIFPPGPANQIKTVDVFAKRDFITDGDKMMVLKIKVLENTDSVDWNDHAKVPNIQIMVVDVGTSQCRSTGDPHFLTFDNLYYNHYQVGDYVLVKSSCRRFEVHVRTWKCATVACNCGFAAREGDDVVVVDMCRDRIPRARFANKDGEPAPGTSIRRDKNGKSFIVTFPSGAFVRMDTYRWFHNWYYGNIIVQVPSDDYKCTQGLCGTFDGKEENEMTGKDGTVYHSLGSGRIAPAEFTESWKLPVGDSLFYHKGGRAKCKTTRVKHFCTCKDSNGRNIVNCNFNTIGDRPKYTQGFEGWKNLQFPGWEHCGKRRNSTSNDVALPNDDDVTQYIYDPTPILNVRISEWPTESGKTLQQVTSYCENGITKSKIGEICKLIPDFNFSPFITQCIEDVQITDNYTMVVSAVRTMQGACEEVFLTNISFWQTDGSENSTLQPPIAIANTLCPNLCSGNGKCVNATCICNSNFTSADCSVDKSKGPTVQSIPLGGLCDVRKRSDCSKTRINGYDFLDSDQLSCRSTHVKISDKPYTKLSKRDVTQGYLLSFAEMLCELESHPVKIAEDAKTKTGVPHAGFLLDVSNDGISFSSKAALYLIYDSKCMDCKSDTGACARKNGTCLINGYCFENGEPYIYDACSICNSSLSSNSFSNATTAKCLERLPDTKNGTKDDKKDDKKDGKKDDKKNDKKNDKKDDKKDDKKSKKKDDKKDKEGKIKQVKQINVVAVAVGSVLGFVFIAAIILTMVIIKKMKQNGVRTAKVGVSIDPKTFENAAYDKQNE